MRNIMKKANQHIITVVKTLSLTVLLSVSTNLLAGGKHGAGHDMSKMKADGGHWTAPTAAAAEKNPVAASMSSVKQGGSLYQKNCASCHGANAKGDGVAGMMLKPKPADLVAMAGGHPDGDFAYKIREGRGAMPAWKNILDDKQVWHLVNYIQSLKGAPMAEKGHHGGMEEKGSHGGGHH